MPEVCREGDELNTGHACDGTTTLDTPSQSTVFAEGQLVARKTDVTVSHDILQGICVPHVEQVNEGDTTVITVGLFTARIGDSADAGNMTSGAGTVFAGGPAG